MALSGAGRVARGGRQAQRATPLLTAAVAMIIAVSVLPNALRTTLTGPPRQGAIAPNHQNGVGPLNLGNNGAGDNGSGYRSGSAPNSDLNNGGVGPSALSGGSGGRSAGSGGSGEFGGNGTGGSGTGPNGTPNGGGPPPPPPPPPPDGQLADQNPPPCSDPACNPTVTGPNIPHCYSNSLGPDSQTTEDPLSPPCVTWDPNTGNGGTTTQGVDGGRIVVVLLGVDPAEDDYLNSPASPAADVCDHQSTNVYCYARNVKVLRQFFLEHFQTYERSVNFYGWRDPNSYPYQLHGKALADNIEQTFHPFALLMTPSLFCCYTGDDVAAIAQDHIETFTFNDIAVDGGLIDQANVEAGSPYLWTINPTTDAIIADGAAWVCDTLRKNPVSLSSNPTMDLGTTPRKIALGYVDSPGTVAGVSATDPSQRLALAKAASDRMAAAADALCGKGGHVFDQFCDAAGRNCEQSIHFQEWARVPGVSGGIG